MKDILKINIGFRYSEIDLLEKLNSNISRNNKPHLAIRRLLWFYIKFEEVYANAVPFQIWLKENPDAYLKSDNVQKFYQVKITAPDEIELLARIGSNNISKFIKYLIDTEEKITNIIISKVRNDNDEHAYYPDLDNNILENSSSIKVNEHISEINEEEINAEALEAARRSFGNLFN